MKIIDLLNKIANGEEIPKQIKFGNKIYKLSNHATDYLNENCDYLTDKFDDFDILNEEVEIIEEDKEIKKIKTLNNVSDSSCLNEFKDKQHLNNHLLKDKINELIDKVNSLEKK